MEGKEDAVGELIHKCMVKATNKEGEDIRCSLNWVFSRRSILRIMSHSLECGDWKIAYSDIDEAVLYSMPWLFLTTYVLRIKSKGHIYQFGLNPSRFWEDKLPFPVKREKANNLYWNIVNIIRFIILGLLIYWIISKIIK